MISEGDALDSNDMHKDLDRSPLGTSVRVESGTINACLLGSGWIDVRAFTAVDGDIQHTRVRFWDIAIPAGTGTSYQ